MILFRKIKSGMILLLSGIKNAFSKIGSFIRVAGQAIKCSSALRQTKKDLPRTTSASELFASFLPDHGSVETNFGFVNKTPTLDLSIIIASYNVENYIKECLDSVLSQATQYKLEVVLVNDGSTDRTKEIVSGYSDERIRYYEQKNAGQSAARNFAIRNSRGSYIMILDSDDQLCPGSIEHLMNLAAKTQSDIVEGGISRFYQTFEFQPQKKLRIKTLCGKKKTNYILKSSGYSCAKVYKRELWNQVRYPIGYIFEDVISKFVLRRIANSVTLTNQEVYAYRWNPASTSHGGNQKKKLDSLLVFPRIVTICDQNRVPKDKLFYLLSLNHIGLLNYITTRFLDDQMRRVCFAVMRQQLLAVQPQKQYGLPFWFALLNRAILTGNYDAWELIAGTIQKYHLLKKYREIN